MLFLNAVNEVMWFCLEWHIHTHTQTHTHRKTAPILWPQPLTREVMRFHSQLAWKTYPDRWIICGEIGNFQRVFERKFTATWQSSECIATTYNISQKFCPWGFLRIQPRQQPGKLCFFINNFTFRRQSRVWWRLNLVVISIWLKAEFRWYVTEQH